MSLLIRLDRPTDRKIDRQAGRQRETFFIVSGNAN